MAKTIGIGNRCLYSESRTRASDRERTRRCAPSLKQTSFSR